MGSETRSKYGDTKKILHDRLWAHSEYKLGTRRAVSTNVLHHFVHFNYVERFVALYAYKNAW